MSGLWSKAHRAVAASEGRRAAQRQLGNGNGWDDADDNEWYLRNMAKRLEREGYSVTKKRCVFCNASSKLKTGTLPHVGALMFCPACEGEYRTYKTGRLHDKTWQEDDELKVHMQDWEGDALCGAETTRARLKVTTDKRSVTCERCRTCMAAKGKS